MVWKAGLHEVLTWIMAGMSYATMASYSGYQLRSVSGGAVQLPPDGSGLRLTVTAPSSSTARRSSGRQVAGAAPGDCGSIAPIANRSG